MGDVVQLNVMTTLDLPADKVLAAAIDAGLQRVIVIGRCHDGRLYFAGSSGEAALVLWDMERAKQQLMEVAEDGDGPSAPHAA